MSTISDILKSSRQVHFLLDLEFSGLTLRLAAKDLVVPSSGDDRRYEAAFLQSFEVGPRFDLRTFRYGSQSISIDIDNKRRLQDEEVRRRLDGGIGTIRVWCDGLTWEDIATDGVIFKGVFQKQSHTRTKYSFDLVDLARSKLDTLPTVKIDQDTWAEARTAGGAGQSPLGQSGQIVFGDNPPVLPSPCVAVNDGGAYRYLITYGLTLSGETEFNAGTEVLKDKDGNTINPANYTVYKSVDGQGNPCTYFQFSGDQASLEPLRFSIQGIVDGNGEFTGTAGGLIEHPAEIVHYILANFSALDPDDVDLASLRTMRGLLPGIDFSVLVNSSTRGTDVVDRILSQCLAARVMRPGGKVGVWTFSPSAPKVGRIIENQDIVNGRPTFSKTPEDYVVNDLVVKYAPNHVTNAWEKTLVYDQSNDPRCKRSRLEYGAMPRFEWTLTDVQDGREASAAALINRFLDLRAFRHDVVEFEAPYWVGWDVFPGDAGLLTLEDGPSKDGSGWTNEPCILIERIFKATSIRQKWLRVTSE